MVARCVAGDTAAFAQLVERYERVLFSVALRMLGNPEDARDATQDAFVKVFQRLHDYKPEHRFFSWIYRILTNECLNALRARRPQEPDIPEMAITSGALEALELEERRYRRPAGRLPRRVDSSPLRGALLRGGRRHAGHPGEDRQVASLHRAPAARTAAARVDRVGLTAVYQLFRRSRVFPSVRSGANPTSDPGGRG